MERKDLTDGEMLERLEAGLRRMPGRGRLIFLAVRLDGAGYAELAERTGLSVGQVERELAAGLVQLRRAVRITERAPALRPAGNGVELVELRWSWPSPTGKPVFNFRGEGRRFDPAERCVILADGFYEFTAPADPSAKRKQRWLFAWPAHDWFGIAAICRNDPGVGEAFTMLTCEPGQDIAPYHDRQVVLLSPQNCFAWLNPANAAADFIKPLPAGSLACAKA